MIEINKVYSSEINGEFEKDGKVFYIESPSEYHSWDFENKKWVLDINGENKILEKYRSEAENEILEKYNIYNQLNILRVGTNLEKEEMSNYIDNIRKESNLKTIEEIERLKFL